MFMKKIFDYHESSILFAIIVMAVASANSLIVNSFYIFYHIQSYFYESQTIKNVEKWEWPYSSVQKRKRKRLAKLTSKETIINQNFKPHTNRLMC